ncbi:hypothetical protein N431DRAFT_379960 [Stipitochalara longipes BDJ]|nr:hypothetical protein N431DRAFT_379960 [Stipitochalara longipes BDJ]
MATVSSLTTKLQGLSQDLLNHSILHSKRNLTSTVLMTALSFPLIYLTWSDYQKWLQLGPGGLPYNIFGYLISTILRPLKASRFDTSFVSNDRILKKIGPMREKAFLKDEDVPERKGQRPEVGKWILPQRQLDQKAGGQKSKERFENLIRSLSDEKPDKLSVTTSVLERTGPALALNSSVQKHPGAYGTRNEIAHLHESEGSLHVCLSPPDAKLVIERGWGERFGLSGSVLPVTYTMVYAPRQGEAEEKEVDIVERIIRAGVKFMLGEEA